MIREKLFKKCYKNPQHDYEINETLQYEDDTGRIPDIAFVYSGRNRGKSFEISTQLIADAWYDKKLFGYIRRNDATTYDIEQYFADKRDFIIDMTDGQREGITRYKGKLYFYHVETDDEDVRIIKDEECGYFFALSRQASYKSLQYPEIFNLVYEEVLTDGTYLNAEPEKLMNLYSTIKRNKEDFKMWLISNTVSVVNPYSKAWSINLNKNKPGDVHLSKLYLGSYDKKGKEEYLLIAAHYLKDKNVLTKEDIKLKRTRIKTSITSNKWDESRLYSNIHLNFMKKLKIKPLETVIFEYDDMIMQGDIIEIPNNLMDFYINNEEIEDMELSDEKIPIIYIRRKSSEPKNNTRIYTNSENRLNNYTTKGFKLIYRIDKVVDELISRGWILGADNLTMNDFMNIYNKLKLKFK